MAIWPSSCPGTVYKAPARWQACSPLLLPPSSFGLNVSQRHLRIDQYTHPRALTDMTRRTVGTPSRRKSVINLFTTPPLRRSVLARNHIPLEDNSLPTHLTDFDDDDDDDENTLTATGDISLSYPYLLPGVAGALSPKPRSRHGTPSRKAQHSLLVRAEALPPVRPRPPARRISEASFKLRTIIMRGGPIGSPVASVPSRDADATRPMAAYATPPPTVRVTPAPARRVENPSVLSSIGTIPDEVVSTETPQSRFEAFMKSRDLTRSPSKAVLSTPNAPLVPEVPRRRDTRPLRGYARLPPRLPIPDWSGMDMD
ncbi:hypothetical protein R3P38DRAFT_3499039 [Favolaschia claudopus]|uniref:Uncharacterized protein n=1 Tax=Favolaschia claudopus TaxID=2862362 RepID=A0AAW0C4P2_9AGAR